jgi:hypothetical protein
MMGMFFSMLNLCPDIKIIDRRKFAVFTAGVVACLTVSALKGNSNFFLHVFALMTGAIAGTLIAVLRENP